MATIGKADLLIVPKFDGLTASVNKALSGVDATRGSKSLWEGVTGGSKLSGAAIGVWSQVASRAMDAVASHVGDAVSRLDTLKNYPQVMQALGHSAEASEASISLMSERLQGLPTTLDDMATNVQGIAVITGDLDKATRAGLALNDMMLSGGQGTQVASSAMEQFRQVLAKGKPDMQDWRSIMQAAPGQLDQLAKHMLGPTAGANDLYEALGGGKNDPTVSMDQLLGAIIELDERGGAGFASFREQAETATGGIQTAVANLGNAVTRGLADVMDSFGRERLVGAMDAAKGAVRGVFDVLADVAAGAGEAVDGIADIWRYGFEGAATGQNKVEALDGAIQSLSGDAGSARRAFDVMGGTVESAMGRARSAADRARDAHDGYLDAVARSADAITEANDAYRAQSDRLGYAASVIDAYAGSTGLGAAQQRELRAAVATVNDLCGTQYGLMEDGCTVINNETGEVQGNTEAIWDNVRARQAAAHADALGSARQEVEGDYAAAANDFQAQRDAAREASDAMDALIAKYGSLEQVMRAANEVDFKGTPTVEARKVMEAVQLWGEVAGRMGDADQAQRQLAQSSAELEAEQAALLRAASGAELALSDLALTSDVAMQAFNDGGSKARLSIIDFGAALQECATDSDALRAALADPQSMARIVAAYDGTAASLRGVFESMGVGWDSAKAAALDAQGTIERMGDFIAGLGTEAYKAMAGMGTSAGEMAAQLSGAGVSMEQLDRMGSDSFSHLLESCGGSVETLTWMVRNYNSVPLVTKDGKVTVETSELVDAQGRVIVWNGTDLVYKGTDAKVDDGQLRDAQGRVYEWNGSTLKPLSTSVSVNTSAISRARAELESLRTQYSNMHFTMSGSVVIDTTRTGSYSGGHYTVNATGGHVPRHAGGFIATGPTLTRYGWIGEDGAELYDEANRTLVPLTNTAYSSPFVAQLVDGVVSALGAGDAALIAELRALREDVRGLGIDIDGRAVARVLAGHTDRALERRGRLTGRLA